MKRHYVVCAGSLLTCTLGLFAFSGVSAAAAPQDAQAAPAPPATAAPAAPPPNAPPPQRRYTPRPPEPLINTDGTVVFSLSAPDAKAVALEGQAGTGPMTRDDKGDWSFTSAPLAPEIYDYRFVVDGVRIVDPRNNWSRGTDASLVCVPAPIGKTPEPWEITDVPHGSVTTAYYTSAAAAGAQRRVHIYTPPGYDGRRRDSYPTLYLLHGSGDDDASWVDVSRANFIFDNLLAQKRMRPMVVVMPFGFMPRGSGRDAFTADLLNDLRAYVEQNYRVKTDASQRALAGLSMGGAQTIFAGFAHTDQFAYLGAWSSGWNANGPVSSDLDAHFPAIAKDGPKAMQTVKLIYLSGGKSDARLLPMTQGVDAWLTQHGVAHEFHVKDGGHQWSVWRESLIEFVPHLFVDTK